MGTLRGQTQKGQDLTGSAGSLYILPYAPTLTLSNSHTHTKTHSATYTNTQLPPTCTGSYTNGYTHSGTLWKCKKSMKTNEIRTSTGYTFRACFSRGVSPQRLGSGRDSKQAKDWDGSAGKKREGFRCAAIGGSWPGERAASSSA